MQFWGGSPSADNAFSIKQTKKITTLFETSKVRVQRKTVNACVHKIPCSDALATVWKLINEKPALIIIDYCQKIPQPNVRWA